MIKRALISVWDKTNLIDFANFLIDNKIEIISTGGTAKYLKENNIKVTDIIEITGIGSIMDGRVKTLNPRIFGGILADRNNQGHLDDLRKIDGKLIDLVVVNLYPFVKEAVEKKIEPKKAIEFIDIGGPSMIRAAAKNYHSVSVLCDFNDYRTFIDNFDSTQLDVNLNFKKSLSAKVFYETSKYDYEIFNFLEDSKNRQFPDKKLLNISKVEDLRYGENPHQSAAFYIQEGHTSNWIKHQGKDLSYNNYMDLQSAIDIVSEFNQPSCAIIKHSNPCGFSIGKDLLQAFQLAITCDPISYFGGIVSFNSKVTSKLAEKLIEPFLECIIAPSFTANSLKVFKKKKNLRIIEIDKLSKKNKHEIRSAAGGFLIQDSDTFTKEKFDKFLLATDLKPTKREIEALKLGWKIVRFVKSNAIVIANDSQILGIGAGQMSRIDSVKIAIRKIKEFGLSFDGAILASDAFFPFADCLEIASKNGIKSIIQPGGSINDHLLISAADEMGMSMILTSFRHFYH